MKQNWKYWLKTLALLAAFAVLLHMWATTFDIFLVALGGTIRGDSYYYDQVSYWFILTIAVGMLGVLWYSYMHNFAAKRASTKIFEKYLEPIEAKWKEMEASFEEEIKDHKAVIKLLEKEAKLNLGALETQRKMIRDLEQALVGRVSEPPAGQHFDDWALDKFVEHMRATLKVKREVEGKGGWETQSAYHLYAMLMSHVTSHKRGNVAHIANYAMMTWISENYPEECEAETLRNRAEEIRDAAKATAAAE